MSDGPFIERIGLPHLVHAKTDRLTCITTGFPTADELDGRTQYIVDGTLLPCWSWASYPELYSGKHDLAWVSDPIDGRRRDTAGWATKDGSEDGPAARNSPNETYAKQH